MKSHDFDDWAKKFDALFDMIYVRGKMNSVHMLEHCIDYDRRWNHGF